MHHRYAQVAVNIPLDRAFDYEIPERLAEVVRPGVIVRVPFGPRSVAGYCVSTSEQPGFHQTKPILGVLETEPVFDEHDLDLARWIASEYAAGIGEVLEAMLPTAVRTGKARPATEFARLTGSPTPGATGGPSTSLRALSESSSRNGLSASVPPFPDGKSTGSPDPSGPVAHNVSPRGAKQLAVLDALAAAGGEAPVADVLASAGASRATLKSLADAGLIELSKREIDPWRNVPSAAPEAPLELMPAQREALQEIVEPVINRRFQGFLLLGVTGSGKTEVYLRAIEQVVAAGRQAIVLVPEIVLTPQTVARFVCRFERVAVLHSHLSVQERHGQWRAIARGDAQVVIGARSAVFAPARKLGIIVIDEEHETSFKQDNSPRYHARDVAMHRARLGNFPVVLGSATPSLEAFHRAGEGEYRLLVLGERVEERPLPEVEIVNMVEERAMRKGRFVLSRRLEQLLSGSLARKEQVMLFLNRRGFTTHLFCPRCGWVAACEHCSISLIHHKGENAVVCHYCGHRTSVPDVCPACRGAAVIQIGMGTERIEEDIRALYPEACVQRMDGDTMSARHAHDDVYRRIRSGEIDILVGTQLIAKGHDFPDVTLVGVVSADTALHFPDFRARERTFQVLTQVAGRTGRSEKGGRVVIQTFHPDEPSIRLAAKHDYVAFARAELADRKARGYPPFTRLVRIVIEGPDDKSAAERARELASALGLLAASGAAQVLGPVPAPIARIKGRFRYHILVKLPPNAPVRPLLDSLPDRASRRGGVSVAVDVDPVNML